MLRTLLMLLLAVLLMPVAVSGQSYSSLWKQADEAMSKDLPQTRIEILGKIADKARRNGDYGQLMKATLGMAAQQVAVAPDSLKPIVGRLEKSRNEATDDVQRAVYSAVLSVIYKNNRSLDDSSAAIAKRYAEMAMVNPALLASAKATGYKPFVVEGINSRIFNDDMLSVIGFETEQFAPMHDYYSASGNRRAACIVALKMAQHNHRFETAPLRKSHCIVSLDSLIAVYGDLDEAGEVAVERYYHMVSCTDVTVEDQIKYINYATQKWPSWQRMNDLRNAYKRLTFPRVNVLTSGVKENTSRSVGVKECRSEDNSNANSSSTRQLVNLSTVLSLRNIEELTVKVYRTSLDGRSELDAQNENDYKKMKAGLVALADKALNRKYSVRPDYEVFNDTLNIGGFEPGVYMFELTTAPETEPLRWIVKVSNIRVMAMELPEKKIRYVVVDAHSGKPVNGAKIELRQHEKNELLATLSTDGNGEAVYNYDKKKPNRFYVYTDTDKALQEGRYYETFFANETNRIATKVKVLTDRAIYRPGQTVSVAAVVYEEARDSRADVYLKRKVMVGKSVKAILRDANYKVVAENTLVTDAFGKCNTTFVLPPSALNGRYTVAVDNMKVGISVEEYKRPTFFVEFPEIKETYRAGDTLVVRGKAVGYNGMPVQGATVKYSVRRSSWWWRYGGDDDGMIANNEIATTAIDGTFAVEVPLVVPENAAGVSRMYHFKVSAHVTDVSGETQQGEMTLPLGTKPVMLSCSLGDQVLADTLKGFTFTLHNAAGNEIDGEVEYTLVPCSSGVEECRSVGEPHPQPLSKGEMGGNKPSSPNSHLSSNKTSSTRKLVNLSTLHSGRYLLTAWSGGDTLKHEFTVFSLNDTVPAAQTDEWIYQSAKQFPADGSPVTVQVGSSDPDLYIYYSIISGNTVLESGVERRNASLINRKLTYRKEYGNGLTLSFAWVKNGVCHNCNMKITRPKQDTDLQMAWKTFRNKLVAGQKEEWTLSIKKSDGTPADAQMVVAMYDKSLDKLRKNQWGKLYDLQPWLSNTRWIVSWQQDVLNRSTWQQWKPLNYQTLDFSRFDHSLFPVTFSGQKIMRIRGVGKNAVMMKTASATTSGTMLEEVKVGSGYVDSFSSLDAAPLQGKIGGLELAENVAGVETAEGESEYMQMQLRENLNETAFFYPALTTDEDGNVSIKFTLPESVTTWRLLGFAHTADMLNNVIEAEAVASKDVMVQPNMPRFVRVGDKVRISARISNSGEKVAKGIALMELVDPEADKVVVRQKKSITVEAGATTSVTFDFAPEEKFPLLICRITASGKTFSDGEQHYLPVLPDKERVTVSHSFVMNEAGTKELVLGVQDFRSVGVKECRSEDNSNASNSSTRPLVHLSTKKVTLEYTDNPAWLVVQALPSLATPSKDNAIDLATAVYVNVLGRKLVTDNPRIKTAVDQWRMEQGEEASLQSSLAKNQELKDIVLSETPWVNEAESEAEQKQMLATFFDANTIDSRVASAIKELGKLQNEDGSWSWYPGMKGNSNITVSVAEMLVRLNKNAGMQKETQAMLNKAMDYLNKETVKQVEKLKEMEKKGQTVTFPGFTTLQILYLNAISSDSPSVSLSKGRAGGASLTSQPHIYLIDLLKKDIKKQSIYEKALTAIVLAKSGQQKNGGEYVESLKQYTVYTEEQGRYYDTSRASYSWRDYRIPTQVAAMEAISELNAADKKTVEEMQRWLLQQKRTQAWDTPINSINAIYAFMNGNKQMLDAQPQAKIKVDGKAVETPKATAALGYVKMKIGNAESIAVEKASDVTSWGTVYMQYFQKTSAVSDQGNGISIKREILNADGKELKVGSRVKVRITVEADRNLDFVQIADKRAACMEPVIQLSGYRNGAYCSPKDNATYYFIDQLPKGKHVIETEYYIDRAGVYETGTCTAECAYSPEFRATAKSQQLIVKE
ncbi:MAG: alpha-2-macroglobulin [Prevotella sp.]|nr:alpha-2-macroglobulin [Prevotella sp.]